MSPYLIGLGALVLFACARVSSDIWRRKGRSALLGFALGVVAGPAGILLAMITPRLDRSRRRRCASCHRWIAEEAWSCPYCRQTPRVDLTGARQRFSAPARTAGMARPMVESDYDWSHHYDRGAAVSDKR